MSVRRKVTVPIGRARPERSAAVSVIGATPTRNERATVQPLRSVSVKPRALTPTD